MVENVSQKSAASFGPKQSITSTKFYQRTIIVNEPHKFWIHEVRAVQQKGHEHYCKAKWALEKCQTHIKHTKVEKTP